MTTREAQLESAVHAQAGLISELQELLPAIFSKEIKAPALIDCLLRLLDRPAQRETERLVREVLGEKEPGNIA